MDIRNFTRVQSLMDNRSELENALELAKAKGLGVTIQGRYQDDAMLDAVREAVVKELRRRIAFIDEDLKALGVKV